MFFVLTAGSTARDTRGEQPAFSAIAWDDKMYVGHPAENENCFAGCWAETFVKRVSVASEINRLCIQSKFKRKRICTKLTTK